jgi:hypothetical protein
VIYADSADEIKGEMPALYQAERTDLGTSVKPGRRAYSGLIDEYLKTIDMIHEPNDYWCFNPLLLCAPPVPMKPGDYQARTQEGYKHYWSFRYAAIQWGIKTGLITLCNDSMGEL